MDVLDVMFSRFVSTEYWHVTDGHLATTQSALCTALRGKKALRFVENVDILNKFQNILDRKSYLLDYIIF